jgi:hypothetical protein
MTDKRLIEAQIREYMPDAGRLQKNFYRIIRVIGSAGYALLLNVEPAMSPATDVESQALHIEDAHITKAEGDL